METARHAAVPLRGLARPRDHERRMRSRGSSRWRIPPAWKDVWISPRVGAKLQATGVDKAGRRQYLYHPEFRARQEQAKFDKLVRFAERLPELRKAMGEHLDQEPLSFEWTAAVAVRLINEGWFRVGGERYAKTSQNLRDHDSAQGTRQGAREQDLVPLPRQASCPLPDGARRTTSSPPRSRSCSPRPAGGGSFATSYNGELVNLGAVG